MSAETGRANATACAALVDEWVRCGVRHAVVAPGSRSTPMALALAQRSELRVEVVHDERVAAFVALGIGLMGAPAILLCTSGTAAVNFHPAVVEAGLSEVPMLVVTADRPPELRGVGAPQTIDQLDLYGRAVRWFHDAPPPDDAALPQWRPLARTCFAASRTGPVHLNVPFREPLVGTAGELPAPLADDPQEHVTEHLTEHLNEGGELGGDLDRQRGVIVVGGRHGEDPAAIGALAERLGWPLLADPTSGCRHLPGAVPAFDAILRHPGFAADHAPELVVRIGRPPASKVLGQWIVASRAPVVQVGGPGVIDPDRNVVARVALPALDGLTGAGSTPWLARWRHASTRAEAAIVAWLGDHPLCEPGVARIVAAAAADAEADVVVASSMPVRDFEWFGGAAARAHANRGANGIDGVISTALGAAIARSGEGPVVVWVGDLAFLHDSNALVALNERHVDLRIVVTDNRGGGIFSFLPQASELATERFEQLFGTPHCTDIVALAAAHGVASATLASSDGLAAWIGRPGPSLARVVTDRAENVAVHAALNAAVAAALS